MGTVVGTCMPEIEHHQTTSDITQLAPIRRRRYGKFIKKTINKIVSNGKPKSIWKNIKMKDIKLGWIIRMRKYAYFYPLIIILFSILNRPKFNFIKKKFYKLWLKPIGLWFHFVFFSNQIECC